MRPPPENAYGPYPDTLAHLEASADVEDAVHRLDVTQEGVPQALAARRPPARQTCLSVWLKLEDTMPYIIGVLHPKWQKLTVTRYTNCRG